MGRIVLFASAVASVLLLTLIYAFIAVQNRGSAAASPTPSGGQSPVGSIEPTSAGVAKDPNAPPYELRDPIAPKIESSRELAIDLSIVEKQMTVADGFVQTVYAYGLTAEAATAPGPTLRVRVGDTLRVTFKNPATNAMPHSLDFHASMVAWNDEMRDINPGEELLYEFTATKAGVFMYHCGTAGVLSVSGDTLPDFWDYWRAELEIMFRRRK